MNEFCKKLKCVTVVLDTCAVCGGTLTETNHKSYSGFELTGNEDLAHLGNTTCYAKNCIGEYHQFARSKQL